MLPRLPALLTTLLVTSALVVACSGSGDDPGANAAANTGAGSSSGGTGAGAGTAEPGTFGAKCGDDKECTKGTDTCVFSTSRGGAGFCSRPCETASECPKEYDCQNIGHAARKYCVPENHLADCTSGCDSYEFFKCFDTGGLAKCKDACQSATVTKRKSFVECAGDAVTCGAGCMDTLATGGSAWVKAKDPCTSDNTKGPQCAGMGLPPNGYTCEPGKKPTQAGCKALPVPDAFCCPK